ncbi:MAG: hypothetical protein ABIH77_04695 [Pseudomonadota bacterium]|nr:hypothetical protein [Gammaproteobacteria bacterium]MBU1558726.1 hypothetical protein [Gammaproteobacteria bacterium]MBU1926893.1 hypothetical protein [Gammaproteobacteria bacterium]MBU2546346.1 hypothetical protein [Gammaproteobacteria bacterium]
MRTNSKKSLANKSQTIVDPLTNNSEQMQEQIDLIKLNKLRIRRAVEELIADKQYRDLLGDIE